MREQVIGSILVGLAVSAVLFLPLIVWQYRRYGRFDGLRMLWITAGYIYASSIVAFTVFPLPEFTPGFCEANATEPLWDPLRFPKAVLELVEARGLSALISDWVVWEFALNIVLFIPFGLIVRRLFEWPRWVVLLAALATSVLIEATQYTGNWGLSPCSYRYADVTDLITNTTGAVLGIGLERITPRLLSTKEYLLARRDQARPVTRGRRLLGMVLDAWYLSMAAAIAGTLAATIYALRPDVTQPELTAAQMLELERYILVGAGSAVLVVVLLPALFGGGASLGQRTVHLAPIPRSGARWRLILRAMIVQGTLAMGLYLWFPTIFLVPLWAFAAMVTVLVNPSALSCALSGCSMHDARALDEDPRYTRESG